MVAIAACEWSSPALSKTDCALPLALHLIVAHGARVCEGRRGRRVGWSVGGRAIVKGSEVGVEGGRELEESRDGGMGEEHGEREDEDDGEIVAIGDLGRVMDKRYGMDRGSKTATGVGQEEEEGTGEEEWNTYVVRDSKTHV